MLGLLVGFCSVFAFSPGGDPIWRVTAGGSMQDITNSCTYNAPPGTPKCASILPSNTVNGDYFEDSGKIVRVSSQQVYRCPL